MYVIKHHIDFCIHFVASTIQNINHHFKSVQMIFMKDRKGSQFWGGSFYLV